MRSHLPLPFLFMPQLANNHQKIAWHSSYLLLLIIGCTGAIGMYLSWNWLTTTRPWGINFFFDAHDLKVYFQSSRWAVGQGTLYKDVFSEYPLFANLIFGFVRYLAEILHPLPSSFDSFSWLWMSLAWFIYVWTVYQATKISNRALWIWLAPAPLYFTLFRFDIYPALTTFLALLAIRQEKYIRGAFWLGLTIALKGYALFLVPSYLVFIYYKKGFRLALTILAICLTPLILYLITVFAYAGIDGIIQPYSFHLKRSTNLESTYDAIDYLLPLSLGKYLSRLSKWLQIATSLLPAVFKPKTFDDLVNAFLFSILGFISFSIFHSPQFVLWIIPIAIFSDFELLKIVAVVYSWVIFIYFPIIFNLNYNGFYFKLIVIAMTAVRLTMFYISFKQLKKFRTPLVSDR